MTITLNALQKQRRDTASNWTSNNPTLLDGELGYETDTKKFKIGDGSTAWQSLDYLPIPDTNRLLAGNLTVGGNFTVNGTTTTIDTTTLTVEDKNIEIGKVSSPSDTTADGGGITLKAASDKTITWSNANDSWDFNQNINAASTYAYKINNVSVLNATTLGSSVVNSSLTSVGTIATGVWNGTAIALTKLATSGTPNNTNFLRGDGAWTSVVTDLVNDTSPQLGGNLDVNTKNIVFGDSSDGSSDDVLTFGVGTDLKIYHDGNDSYISNTGAGNLIIRGDDVHIQGANGDNMANFIEDGSVQLRHDGTVRLETTSGGVKVTGNVELAADGDTLLLGSGSDFQISHDGNNNVLKGVGNHGILFYTNNSEKMRIDSSGRLLLGTTTIYSTSADDFILATTGHTGITIASGVSSAGNIYFADGASGDDRYAGYIQYNHNDSFMALATGATERMRIDSSGRLGLGSSNPSAGRIVVTSSSDGGFGGSLVLENSNGSDTDKVGIALRPNGSATTAIGSYGESRIVCEYNSGSTNGANHLQFHTHAGDGTVGERMRIDSSGKLGIGTTSPSDNLHVADSGATEVYLRLSNSTVSNGWSLGPRGSDGRFQVVQNGVRDSLAISTDGKFTAPTIYSLTTSGGSAVYVESDGDLLRYTSSLKYKTDIETLEDKRADNILNCRPVWYKSTCNNDIKTKGAEKSDWGWYGFIAEEIAEIDPRLVNWATKDAVSTENGSESVERDPSKYTAEGVRYDNFVPLLVNLLKRQKEQIEILETKVAALEAA